MSEPVPEKRVGWAELFFDLVFVFAVTDVSSLLEHHRTWSGLLHALVLFVPIYWMWVGTAVQTNQRDIAAAGLRVKIFLVALASIFMALAVPEAFETQGLLFACAYWAGRIVLGAGLLPGFGHGRFPLNPYTVSMVLTGPLFVVGALTHGDVRWGIWALAALIDLSTPSVLRRQLRGMHFDPAHLAERFGLFVLIALGESVVAIGSSAQTGDVRAAVVVAVAAAFALSCGIWWVYFHFAADAMRHALATAAVQLDVTRQVLSYGHLVFIGAIIVASVGMREAVGHPGEALHWAGAGLLYGGVAAFLTTFGWTRWSMFRLVSWTRLGAAAVVLVALPVAAHLPALAALILLAVILAALNVLELSRNERIGWRALLGAR